MNNKQVAQAWASQTAPNGKGSNLFFEGRKLYSYGYHYLLAELSEDGKVARFNPTRYSQTTTRHRGLALAACRKQEIAVFDWSSDSPPATPTP